MDNREGLEFSNKMLHVLIIQKAQRQNVPLKKKVSVCYGKYLRGVGQGASTQQQTRTQPTNQKSPPIWDAELLVKFARL